MFNLLMFEYDFVFRKFHPRSQQKKKKTKYTSLSILGINVVFAYRLSFVFLIPPDLFCNIVVVRHQ